MRNDSRDHAHPAFKTWPGSTGKEDWCASLLRQTIDVGGRIGSGHLDGDCHSRARTEKCRRVIMDLGSMKQRTESGII